MNFENLLEEGHMTTAWEILDRHISQIANEEIKEEYKKQLIMIRGNYKRAANDEITGIMIDREYKKIAVSQSMDLYNKTIKLSKSKPIEPTTDSVNIVKYIENRAWFSCCGFNETKIKTLKDLSFLQNSNIFSFANLALKSTMKYLFRYEKIRFIEIELNNKGVREFNERFCNDNRNVLIAAKIRIFENGLANTLFYFDLYDYVELEVLEMDTYELINIVDKCIHIEMDTLFSSLIDENILTKTEYYHWAIPEFIQNNEITIEDSCNLKRNIFISDESIFSKLTKNIDLTGRNIKYKNLVCSIIPGERINIWQGEVFDINNVDHFNIEFIILAESTIYNITSNTAMLILHYINSMKSLKGSQFKYIINYTNEVLLSLRSVNTSIDMYDRSYLSFILQFWNTNEKYKYYKDTEDRLKFAIKSVDDKKFQNALDFLVSSLQELKKLNE